MSSIIRILPDHVINKIAAGEVVERPASAVKELIENALDAGATEIAVDIEQAGKRLIRISDNGCGMSREDVRSAFLRHATSKIAGDEDLEAVRTMGFRGEALSSIASVSQVRLQTAMRGQASGVRIEIEAGKVTNVADAAAPQGTSIEVSHLFYNTPARLKFLKSPGTEFSHILTTVSRLAMSHPAVRFKLSHNRKTVLDLPEAVSAKERVFQLYGAEIAENVIPFSGGRDNIHVHGLIGRPSYSRAERTYQDFYVNRRAVRNSSLTHALYGAYGDLLMRDRHPVAFVFIDLDPALVDVNVHPAKAEVRFRNQSQLHDLVRDTIREGLRTHGIPVPAPFATAVSSFGGAGEALADYMQDRLQTDAAVAERKASILYGRRRSDGLQEDTGSGVRREAADKGAAVPSLIPEHGLVPLAQIHDSFIIAQSREGMAVVDQHAAHERVLFERLQDQFSLGHIPVQDLLVPDQLELGPAQSALLSGFLPELQKIGFIAEDFGQGTFVIKAVPSLLAGIDYKKILLDVLDEVNVHGSSRKMEALRDEVLSVMACHPAIKVHRRLSMQEMEVLLDGLFACRMPHSCPHGRPTVVRFTMDELKKMFKRI